MTRNGGALASSGVRYVRVGEGERQVALALLRRGGEMDAPDCDDRKPAGGVFCRMRVMSSNRKESFRWLHHGPCIQGFLADVLRRVFESMSDKGHIPLPWAFVLGEVVSFRRGREKAILRFKGIDRWHSHT